MNFVKGGIGGAVRLASANTILYSDIQPSALEYTFNHPSSFLYSYRMVCYLGALVVSSVWYLQVFLPLSLPIHLLLLPLTVCFSLSFPHIPSFLTSKLYSDRKLGMTYLLRSHIFISMYHSSRTNKYMSR